MRLVSSASDCRPQEYGLTWNAQSIHGETGPQGDHGIPGLSELQMVSAVQVTENLGSNGTSGAYKASCPSGKLIIGGGAYMDNGNWALNTSYPSVGNTWTATFRAIANAGNGTATVYAICAVVH